MPFKVNNGFTNRLLNAFFGTHRDSFGFMRQSSSSAWSASPPRDVFSFNSVDAVIRKTVEKLQAAVNRSPAAPAGAANSSAMTTANSQLRTVTSISTKTLRRTGGNLSSLRAASSSSMQLIGQIAQIPPPSREHVERALSLAGGRDAVQPWAVDGKTKVEIAGRKTIVNIDGDGENAPAESGEPKSDEELRDDVAAAIGRFGLDASLMDGGADHLRESLETAAAGFTRETPELALAIEYALEDAYAKIHRREQGENGAAPAVTFEEQREINLEQAKSVAGQLNLGGDQIWGVDSLAEDLAVFGLDLSAMSGDAFELAETVRAKSREMLDGLQARCHGTEGDFTFERNRITGASARLVNGLESSAGVMSRTSMELSGSFSSSRVSVSVGGASVDANAIIAVSNVIVDPLVLDLEGDGIDLSSADEGVRFDMDGDGQKEQTGFIRGDDALLFVDDHGDGVVHDGRQLFGNTDGHANGFEKLRAHDSNADGVIDENDEIWDKLMVWRDNSGDGVSERSETMTLAEAGVKSVNVGYRNTREDDGKGNLVGQTGSFTRHDGTEGLAADVWLREKKSHAAPDGETSASGPQPA